MLPETLVEGELKVNWHLVIMLTARLTKITLMK